jgi:NitT/TauT family transport system substrate-binding protein
MKKILISIVAFLFATSSFAKEVTLLMDWFPQGNQSGYWQAEFDNQYHKDITIKVKAGGPKVNTTQMVASGQVEFGLQGSDSVMMANSKGAGLKGIFVSLNHVPYTLVFHPNQGIKTVNDLEGRPFAVKMGVTYWKWVKYKYGVSAKEFPLTGDLGLFARTPTQFQQGYSLFLPARLAAKGVATEQITLESLGYRPYSVLFTTDKMIKENPELVQAVVDRLSISFHKSLVDPKPTRDFILSKSKKVNAEIHNNALELMKADFLPQDWSKIGCQDPNRWVELSKQLKDINMLPADFNPHDSYDTSFKKGCFN